MTTSTAGTKRPKPGTPNNIYVGQTFRTLQLKAGPRPFAVVVVDVENDRASGWLMLDPQADRDDPLLKEAGIQAADRQKPCYITVRTDQLK